MLNSWTVDNMGTAVKGHRQDRTIWFLKKELLKTFMSSL